MEPALCLDPAVGLGVVTEREIVFAFLSRVKVSVKSNPLGPPLSLRTQAGKHTAVRQTWARRRSRHKYVVTQAEAQDP